MKNYIAYGSNMDVYQMAVRCPEAKIAGVGMIDGYQLLFKGSKSGNYATIEPENDHKVPVLMWEISHNDERRLDMYEGYPSFYYKKIIRVRMNDGRQVDGMAYIMHEKRELGYPSLQYYGVLSAAYDKFNFDMDILAQGVIDSQPSKHCFTKNQKRNKMKGDYNME